MERVIGFMIHMDQQGNPERGAVKTVATEHTSSLDAFFGASSNERLATKGATTQSARRFKSLRHAHEPVPTGDRDGGT